MLDDQYGTRRISSWETSGLSTTHHPPRSFQNTSSLPISSTNYVVPMSRYSSQVHPQLNTKERQLQPYQQPQYESLPTEKLPSAPNEAKKTNLLQSCKQHISVTRVIGLLVGLVLTGVPLAVMVTLLVQLSASSNSTTATTPSTTVSTSIGLPYQCGSTVYIPLNDATRLVTSTAGCCSCESLSGWYQVTGLSGTRLATSPVSGGYCSSNSPAWFNGSLPSGPGSTTIGTQCVNYLGSLCHPSYSISNVMATNCNGFYVFYLYPFSCCCSGVYPRYCTV